MQETWVWSLIWEDPTCHRATKPTEPVLGSCSYWAHAPQLLKPACLRACALQQEKPKQWATHTVQLESSPHNWRKACTATKIQHSHTHTKEKISKTQVQGGCMNSLIIIKKIRVAWQGNIREEIFQEGKALP